MRERVKEGTERQEVGKVRELLRKSKAVNRKRE